MRIPYLPQRGELTNACLLLSTMSGLVLLFQYDVAMPLESVVYINSILPFGWLWRSVHYWSSQLFLFFLLAHLFERFDILDKFEKKRKKNMASSPSNNFFAIDPDFIKWLVLISTIFLGILALFTGYVIRWDETGRSAGEIASEILKTIPIIGEFLDRAFMDTGNEGINKPFALHINATFILWGIGSWYHTKRIFLGKKAILFALITSLIISAIFIPQLKSPDMIAENIKGPWFFLGVQELLRYLPVFWAGVIFPLAPIFLLICMFFAKKKALFLLILWLLIYFFLTILAILR